MLEIIALIVLVIIFLAWQPYTMMTHQDGGLFIATSQPTLNAAMDMLQIKEGDVFFELGSGDGRAVITAAMQGATAYGVEIDRLRILYSRIWLKFLRLKNAQIIQSSFYDIDLRSATIVFMYLPPKTIEKLEIKFRAELKPGTKIASIGFPIESWKPVQFSKYGPTFLYIV